MKKAQTLTFTFEDPNTPEAFREALKQILLDRLTEEAHSSPNAPE